VRSAPQQSQVTGSPYEAVDGCGVHSSGLSITHTTITSIRLWYPNSKDQQIKLRKSSYCKQNANASVLFIYCTFRKDPK